MTDKKLWLTGHQVSKMYNIDRKKLYRIRLNNNKPGFVKQGNGRSYRYNAFMLPDILKKEAV